MNDHTDAGLRDAFDNLRHDTLSLDTMTALRSVESRRRRRRTNAIVLSTAAVVLVALVGVALWVTDDPSADLDAAGDPDRDGGDPDPADDLRPALLNSSWTLVEGTGPDGPIPVVPGWPITLTFEDGVLGGTAACNGYGGDYTLDGAAIEIGPSLAQTEMLCGDPSGDVMRSEGAFLGALRGVDTVTADATTMQLSGPSILLRFTSQPAVPIADIVDREWVLDSLIDGNATTAAVGDRATLVVNDDGTLAGGTGCRSFTGDYVARGAWLEVINLSMEGSCDPEMIEQDSAVVSVLEGTLTVELADTGLTLGVSGSQGLHYVLEPASEALDIDEFLDTRPEDAVDVRGHLLFRGGSWTLCENLRDPGPTCAGRWVVVTNYDALVDGTASGFESAGDIDFTPESGIVSLQLLDDGRAYVPDHASGTELTEDEVALLDAFASLSETGPVDVDPLRLAPEVVIGVGPDVRETRTPEELGEPANWRLEVGPFRGAGGPTYSALEMLDELGSYTMTAGRHDHCASPPEPIPQELQTARQLSLQPAGIDSCLMWSTVDVFVDAGGQVIGITYDFGEP